ncbi:aminodeoxychorismate synthase component I [Thiothrix subterranea]|uniref:Aminodeoxychorismate synthase component I n=1 Tax=Thiothrix subterranea TaxID=2735563 RepID=A0AA51MNU5_9GAMM|nr:aminodeoxychorismate synthase component I [Thiothrix subterranea]MDQ5767726.1 aminodeoxychorismate synthase component I [Thiothrix subterranea]WML85531.1 aminodeoxychorismate synthase component I [Thiothrix subterranea]
MHTQIFKGEYDLLALHSQNPTRYPFLLESVATSPLSRYSLLFAFPQESIRLDSLAETSFCERLDAAWSKKEETPPSLSLSGEEQEMPFRGGWFLYLGYELVGQLEPTLQLPDTPASLPIALAVRIPAAVIVDHLRTETIVVAEQEFAEAFAEIKTDMAATNVETQNFASLQVQIAEDLPEQFTAGVECIREYIAAGDVFQVNLSRAWRGDIQSEHSATDVYRLLRKTNPAPFACLADFGEFAVISSSPERLVRVQAGRVDTRPIAGTRPRGADPERDQALLEELIANPKERAEHIMLIDLERNDLGRICEYGTVKVDELMVVESYQHVHHIVSNIQGTLREGITPGQIIHAVFPGGTITGCPKVRCMEIIAELEQTGRGAYTGSVGYLNRNGDMDLNILIRTMTLQGKQLQFRTGAGIVMDSVAPNELKETRHKARGLLRALGHDMG